MVDFYKNPECTEILGELRFDDSYIEDIYGAVLQNVVEVGTEAKKIIYAKNHDADIILIKSLRSESSFISMIVENPKLKTGESTAIHVTFKPTLEELQKLESMGEEDKKIAKEKLLKGNIQVSLYRVTVA